MSKLTKLMIWFTVGITGMIPIALVASWANAVARQHAALRPIVMNDYDVSYEGDQSLPFRLVMKFRVLSPDLFFRVRRISCEGLYTPTNDSNVAQFAMVPGVRSLSLVACANITDKSVDSILKMQSLRSVELRDSGISPAGIRRLRSMRPELQIDIPEANSEP